MPLKTHEKGSANAFFVNVFRFEAWAICNSLFTFKATMPAISVIMSWKIIRNAKKSQ